MDNENFNIKRYLGKLILEFNKKTNKIIEQQRVIDEQQVTINRLQERLDAAINKATTITNFENIKNMSVDDFVDYIYSVFLAGRMSAMKEVEYEDYKEFLMQEYNDISNGHK